MDNARETAAIRAAIEGGDARLALRLAQETGERCGDTAELHYLRGKAHMRLAEWTLAINEFLRAEELDAESPARECRRMLEDILAFYNKDMYNQ